MSRLVPGGFDVPLDDSYDLEHQQEENSLLASELAEVQRKDEIRKIMESIIAEQYKDDDLDKVMHYKEVIFDFLLKNCKDKLNKKEITKIMNYVFRILICKKIKFDEYMDFKTLIRNPHALDGRIRNLYDDAEIFLSFLISYAKDEPAKPSIDDVYAFITRIAQKEDKTILYLLANHRDIIFDLFGFKNLDEFRASLREAVHILQTLGRDYDMKSKSLGPVKA